MKKKVEKTALEKCRKLRKFLLKKLCTVLFKNIFDFCSKIFFLNDKIIENYLKNC